MIIPILILFKYLDSQRRSLKFICSQLGKPNHKPFSLGVYHQVYLFFGFERPLHLGCLLGWFMSGFPTTSQLYYIYIYIYEVSIFKNKYTSIVIQPCYLHMYQQSNRKMLSIELLSYTQMTHLSRLCNQRLCGSLSCGLRSKRHNEVR